MTRPVPEAAAVPSPCIGICRMDARSGWCEGCLRSLDEIAAWSTMSEADKRQVWQQLPLRQQAGTAPAGRNDGSRG